MSRVGWVDASMGVSGDMLLSALSDLGALEDWSAVTESMPFSLSGSIGDVEVNGLRARSFRYVGHESPPPERRLSDLLELLEKPAIPEAVRERAASVFRRIAEVEARVHGVTVDEVHFHEVGAADAILDVVGVCLGMHVLGLDALVVSSIALGGGTVRAAHGELAVPAPAVLGLLADTSLLAHGGPVDSELATPTGVALLAEWATTSGPIPPGRVSAVGVGAGDRRFESRANVLRLVVLESDAAPVDEALLLETNVDDLEPRLWPGVIDALLAAGASDAWLTPILMKKGRPAHTLSVLTPLACADRVRAVVFAETTAIGLREQQVGKHALERRIEVVTVRGEQVRVKVALRDGHVVNVQPEWDDVRAAAAATATPAKTLLAEATAAAQGLGG